MQRTLTYRACELYIQKQLRDDNQLASMAKLRAGRLSRVVSDEVMLEMISKQMEASV